MAEGTIEDKCFVCGVPRLTHQLAEERGAADHAWVKDNSSYQRPHQSVTGGEVARPPVVVMVVPAPDLVLRRLLVDRGVITEADEVELKRRDVAPQIPRDLL